MHSTTQSAANDPKRRELVMTLAYRYGWKDLAVFANSLKASNFKGDFVVFSAAQDRTAVETMRAQGIIVIPVFLPLYRLHNVFLLPGWAPYRALFRSLPGFRWKQSLGKFLFSLMCARFAHFHDYLVRHRDRYDRVALADVRDVVFQTEPFAQLGDHRLVSFLEDRPIRDSDLNRAWVIETYGESGSQHLMDKTVVCAGVTLGTTEAMEAYLCRMLEGMFAAKKMHPVSGTDQAIHNEIFHSGLAGDCTMLANGNPLCLTMGPGEPFIFDDAKRVTNDSQVISILHQYDRHPELKQVMNERFGN